MARLLSYVVLTPDQNIENPFWLEIGITIPHKDGKGFHVTLSALPTDGQLTLREKRPLDDRRFDREQSVLSARMKQHQTK